MKVGGVDLKRVGFYFLVIITLSLWVFPINAESKIPVIVLPLVDNTQVDVGFVSYIYRKTTSQMYTDVINTTFREIITERFSDEIYEVVDLNVVDSLLQDEGYNINLLDLPDRIALMNIATRGKVRGIIGIEFFQFGTHFIPYKPKDRPWMLSCRLRAYDVVTNRFINICFTKNEIYSGSTFGVGEDDKNISIIVKDLVTKTMQQALEHVTF